MSCGNRFVCGIRRYDQHKISNDKPSNKVLHDENNKRLQELMNMRSQQDKGVFTPIHQSGLQVTGMNILQNFNSSSQNNSNLIPKINYSNQNSNQNSNTIPKTNNINSSERVIDFDTYLHVD
jgi:hypothetical protein